MDPFSLGRYVPLKELVLGANLTLSEKRLDIYLAENDLRDAQKQAAVYHTEVREAMQALKEARLEFHRNLDLMGLAKNAHVHIGHWLKYEGRFREFEALG